MQQFYKRFLFLLISFITTTQFYGIGYAQSSNWLALSNGPGQALDITVDQKGNVYSLGKENREMEFRSADSLGPKHHSHVPWNAQFIAQHSPDGALNFVLHFVSIGGNQNTTSTQKIIVLDDNRIAATVYCSNRFYAIDSQGDSTELPGRSSALVIFSESGRFQESIPLPMKHSLWTGQLDDGSIYVLGNQSAYTLKRKKALCRVDLRLQEARMVNDDLPGTIAAMIGIGNTLWFLDMEVTCSEYYYQCKTYDLYKITSGSSTPQLFESYDFGLCRSNKVSLVQVGNEPQVIFRVEPGRGTGVSLNDYTIPYVKDYTNWLFMDAHGSLLKTINIDGIGKGETIQRSENGDYFISYIVYDSLKIEGEDPIVIPKEHPPFIYELCIVKLSSDYRVQDVILSGGISDANQAPFLIDGKSMYISGMLHSDCVIDGVERNLSWSHGYFVRKVGLKTGP